MWEETWERRNPPVRLSLDEITELIRPAFPGAAAVDAEWIAKGQGNTLYKVRMCRLCDLVFLGDVLDSSASRPGVVRDITRHMMRTVEGRA